MAAAEALVPVPPKLLPRLEGEYPMWAGSRTNEGGWVSSTVRRACTSVHEQPLETAAWGISAVYALMFASVYPKLPAFAQLVGTSARRTSDLNYEFSDATR